MGFVTATREKSKLRLAIDGPTGSGKSVTAFRMGLELARYEGAKAGVLPRMAVICSERGRARKYIGDLYDGFRFAFDIDILESYAAQTYIASINNAARLGYHVVVVDSLSHAWNGKDGILQLVDRLAEQQKDNKFSPWKDATPLQDQLVDSITKSPIHVIATMRSKMKYALETNERGKLLPRKIGLAPIQRNELPYEFDFVLNMDASHVGHFSKSMCSAVDGMSVEKPGAELMQLLIHWLDTGNEIPAEKLDAARLVDAPPPVLASSSGSAPAAAAQRPAAVDTDDLAARMAAKKAAAAAAQNGNATNASVSNAVATSAAVTTPAAVITPVTAAGPANTSPLADKTSAASATATQANSTGGATTTVATTPVPSVSDNQTTVAPLAPLVILAEISALFDKLEATPDQRQVSYTKRNATSLETLTPESALNLLGGLRNIVAEKYPGFAYTPATVTHITPTGPSMVTGEQVDRIRKLFTDLQVPEAARIQALQRRGASAVSDLTEERANDLIHGLIGKLSGFENLPAFHPHFPENPQYANEGQRKLAESMKVPFDGGKPLDMGKPMDAAKSGAA